jgi:hypothetical protein
MVIPDLRCCFDYFRWPTTLADWLDALSGSLMRPTASQVFLQYAYNCRAYLDGAELLGFDITTPRDTIKPLRTLHEAYERLVAFYAKPDDVYHDVHCSALTPASFEQLLLELRFLGLISLECHEIRGPAGGEFYVHLRNPSPGSGLAADSFYAQRERLMRRVIAEMALKT